MEDVNKWYALNEKMEKFMYGDRGIITTAFVDENLNTYLLDTDKIIKLLKELKELEETQVGLTENQKKQLNILKDRFLEIENGKNNVKEMYQEIKKIYENIEEY